MDIEQEMRDCVVVWVPLLDLDDSVYGVRQDVSDEQTVELAEDIKERGLINPITAVQRDGVSIVVAGHRRYAACKMAGCLAVPVIFKDLSEVEIRQMVFSENFFRENPSPMEEAQAISDGIESGAATEEELAKGFGKSVGWLRERLKLLEYPQDLQDVLHAGELPLGVVRQLVKVKEGAERDHLVEHALAGGINERTARAWVQAWQASVPMAEVVLTEGEAPRYIPLDRQAECPCLVCQKMGEPGRFTNVLVCPGCVEAIRGTATE